MKPNLVMILVSTLLLAACLRTDDPILDTDFTQSFGCTNVVGVANDNWSSVVTALFTDVRSLPVGSTTLDVGDNLVVTWEFGTDNYQCTDIASAEWSVSRTVHASEGEATITLLDPLERSAGSSTQSPSGTLAPDWGEAEVSVVLSDLAFEIDDAVVRLENQHISARLGWVPG